MANYTAPGVYIEEVETGSRPIEGSSTSIGGFIGITKSGKSTKPQLITNFAEFTNSFGGKMNVKDAKCSIESEDVKYGYLAYAVESFFDNGGSTCYVRGISMSEFFDDGEIETIKNSAEGATEEEKKESIAKKIEDEFKSNKAASSLIEKYKNGIKDFEVVEEVSFLAIPGVANTVVIKELEAHCENLKDRMAIIDIDSNCLDVESVKSARAKFGDSSYLAVYHPWFVSYDSVTNGYIEVPPSGAVAGVFARSDSEKGVHKAPANEAVRKVMDVTYRYSRAEQENLNPNGVNIIKPFPDGSIRIWGARTLSSNPLWKYVNIRRLFIYIEESIMAGTSWAVFQPNNEQLWARVKLSVTEFLTDLWRTGAMMGLRPEQAFFVNVGRTTMSENDIKQGRLIIEVGIAATSPAEFVIFKISQMTGESK